MERIHIVCGPTASGKTSHALELAKQLNGVIINCDSLQIYDGLPILTAQPTPEEKDQAPHALYAALRPNDICSAGNWREMVEPIITQTLENGQTPIITGGSGLYIKALTHGLSPMPDTPEDIRDLAVKTQQDLGNPAFYEDLKKRDPVMTARFHPHHTARLIRAWEVIVGTGKSLAEWQELPLLGPPDHWHFEIHKIIPERAVLYERCNTRFDWMIENGALEEAEEFNKRIQAGDIAPNVPITKALGFKHLCAYLNGDMTKEDALTESKTQTRRYAKRQTTWFRHQL